MAVISYNLGTLDNDDATKRGREREKGIDKLVFVVNAARAAQVPPLAPLTRLQIVRRACDDLFERYANDYVADLRARVSAALATATTNTVTNVATELGIDENPWN